MEAVGKSIRGPQRMLVSHGSLRYNFIDINDFRVIFWQKLANLYDVICAINLFSVKIDKNKLQSGYTPLQTHHWSLLN